MTGQEIQRRVQLSPDNPWPGLESFDEASESFFFGMRAQTDALIRLVRRETLTLFYGRSGLGKTSLLQAGLFPRLREARLLPIPIRLDYGPKAIPFDNQIKQAVARAVSDAGMDARPPAEGESLWEYFHSSGVDFWDSENRLVTLVLVFDQFEERFTLGRQSPETDRRAESFLTELSQLVENRPPPLLKAVFESHGTGVGNYDFDKHSCNVILSLREDFLPELENLRDRFPSILENTLRLQAMTEAQAMEVVLGPGSHLVSEQVAAEIVRFVGGADQRSQACFTVEPVLLSVVLYGLNQRRRENDQALITSDLLSGNREQILDGFYEDAMRDLPARARLLVEDGLLTSSGRRDTLAWEDALVEFAVAEQEILTLIDRHLLRREDRSDGARIELVHDRLAEVVRKHRDSRREQESKARALADLQARQAELEREKEFQRRKSRRLLVACVALALFGLLVSGYIVLDRYQHRWHHETYFSNFTKRFGIFEGIGPLTAEQVSRRSSCFRFIRRGASGPLIRVQAVDPAGRLTHRHSARTYVEFKSPENDAKYYGLDDNPARECQWKFVEDAAGRIVYEVAYDKNDRLVRGLVYSPSPANSLQTVAHFVGPNGLPDSQTTSGAEYFRIEYWPNGLEKRLSYFDRAENPQIGLDGAYAIYTDYDALGLPKRVVAMDADGKPMTNKEGVAITEYARDAMGNPTEKQALDAAGKPALTKDGWSREVFTHDVNGNEIEVADFDARGEPCLNKAGFAKVTVTYDGHGNPIVLECYDVLGKPCLLKEGYAKITSRFDEHGNAIEAECFDTNGRLCLNKSGFAKTTKTYDERGDAIGATYFDASGQRCLSNLGYAAATVHFDDRSNWIDAEFYGVDGKPCLNKEGYTRATAEYDKRSNLITMANFGLNGRPTLSSIGAQKVKMFYDERGNRIGWEYYGVDGERCLVKDGYAKMTAKYDERANQIETAFFDEEGKPVRDNDGIASLKARYDERGNKIEIVTFDEEGRPAPRKEGYVRLAASYDARGNEIAESYFDEAGKPVRSKEGYALFKASFDERGNQIAESYFDEAGKPVRGNDGFARFTAGHDERGNQITGAYFDEADKPVCGNDGFARFTARYDERGNKIELATFDQEGKPIRRKEGYARFTATYDERGNQIEAATFDEKGKPVLDNEGLARFTSSFDERGNRIAGAFFDECGKPARDNEGLARFTASFDARGNRIACAYFDEKGKPVRDYEGFARFTASYDNRAHRTSVAYYDVDGNPCLSNEGYAKATSKYDHGGHLIQQVEFDLTDKSTVKTYDSRGNEIEEAYFDEKGSPRTNPDGLKRWIARYADGSDPKSVTYFDDEGKPTAVEIYIAEVLPGGQAKEAGLSEGDILVSYDGRMISDYAEFLARLHAPGETKRDLVVSRGSLRLSFALQPGRLGVLMKGRILQPRSVLGSNALHR
jgi:eukaryotic-like serine/threonine-protein kinase